MASFRSESAVVMSCLRIFDRRFAILVSTLSTFCPRVTLWNGKKGNGKKGNGKKGNGKKGNGKKVNDKKGNGKEGMWVLTSEWVRLWC